MTWSQLSTIQKVFTVVVTALVLLVFNGGCLYHPSWLSVLAVIGVDGIAVVIAVKALRSS